MENKASAGKSRKKLIIAIIIIAAVLGAGIFVYSRLTSLAGTTTAEIPSTVLLSKTDLENKVTGSGNFASTDPVTVGSNVQYGEVETVYVKAGDYVYEGDVLAMLKTSDLERSISDTTSALSTGIKSAERNKAAAQRSLDEASANLDAAFAEFNLARAARDYEAGSAQTDMNNAKAALDNAFPTGIPDEANPENPAFNPADPIAVSYNDLLGKYNAAKAAYESKKALADTVSAAEKAYNSANSAWHSANDRVNELNEQDVTKQERSTLESLNEDLDNASIVSPISGTVTMVTTEEGKASAGNMFTIENTEELQVSTSVAEYDILKIEPGMTAYITSNATGDQEYEGIVDYVASTAIDSSGNFEVTVKLTGEIGQLKPGMTATVEIVTAAKNDIFAVPIDAVVTLEDGRKVVYAYEPDGGLFQFGGNRPEDIPEGSADGNASVTREGAPASLSSGTANFTRREIEVTTGMETDYYIEISSDELTEGMMILSDPMGLNVNIGSGMDFGMFGGGGMMGGGGAEVRIESESVAPPRGDGQQSVATFSE